MADEPTSNVAAVAIVLLVLIALGVAWWVLRQDRGTQIDLPGAEVEVRGD